MEAIASSKDERDMIHSLIGDDAQTIINVIDEVRLHLFMVIEIDIDASCRLGTGFTRYPGMGTGEMPPIVVQDMR